MPITSTHLLIAELEQRSSTIKGMNLYANVADVTLEKELYNFANTPAELDRVVECADALCLAHIPSEVETALCQLLVSRHFYGQYTELAMYAWLLKNQVSFSPQQKLTGADVLNPKGCTIDGHVKTPRVYFDIKGVGLQAYVVECFRRSVEKQFTGMKY